MDRHASAISSPIVVGRPKTTLPPSACFYDLGWHVTTLLRRILHVNALQQLATNRQLPNFGVKKTTMARTG